MAERAVARPRAAEFLLVCLAAAVLLGLAQWQGPSPPPVRADAARYLDYAVNLRASGVFGLSVDAVHGVVPPGRANTPLYPALVALVFTLAGTPAEALRCHLAPAAPGAPCVSLDPLVATQLGIAALGLGALWLAAWRVLGTRRGAWLAALVALASGQPSSLARQVLTENLSLPLCAFLVLALLAAWQGGARAHGLLGLVLGLLALTRPEYLYLAPAVALAMGVRAAWRHQAGAGRALAALLLGFTVVVAPWLARNQHHFGDAALTTTYGGRTLAQRVQYNRMTGAEFACAFVYWLPDFGDSLARRLLPPSCYRRLAFGPGSYYRDGRAHYLALRARHGEAGVTAALVRQVIEDEAAAHARATVALAWRAVFVAKLWGALGLAALLVLLARSRELRPALLLAAAPGAFMLVFYAGVSVAIPRYALCLLPPFAIAIAGLATARRRAR